MNYKPEYEKECKTRGVTYSVFPNAQFNQILSEIANPEVNQDAIKLEVAPKVAVYTPEFDHTGARIQPWDDAVMLALTYAEIPYDKIYDEEVLNDKSAKYDWLHLHHEDFTGQLVDFTLVIIPPRGTEHMCRNLNPWLKDLALEKFLNSNWQ